MMTQVGRRQFAIVVILAGVIWFALPGYRDLFDPDEGRYAQIPAAMVDTGDWLTPRLNGVKYFEKPVLQYWAMAAVYTLAGKSNASARLVPAVAGFLGALLAALLARSLFGARAGFFAFLFSASGLMWVAVSHILNLDILLSTCLFTGMGCLAIAQTNRTSIGRVRMWMLTGWAALALAVLSKGLIGLVLPVASVMVYSAWQRDWIIWKHLHLAAGLLLFFLLVSPWFVAVSLKNPEFLQFFFVHEHWERYTTTVHHREGPIYYFIPILLLGLLPWLWLSLQALLKPACGWKPENPGTFDAVRLLWSFVAVTFVFFSLGNSKLPAYILPLIPAVAVLAARRAANAKNAGQDRWLMALLGAFILVLAFNTEHLFNERYTLQMLLDYRPWLLASGSLFVLASAAMFVLAGKPLTASAIAALLSLLAFQLVLWGAQSIAVVRSSREVAQAVMDSVPPEAPVYSVGTFPESAVFYLGKNLKVVHYVGEFEFGFGQEPDLQIDSPEQFLSEWRRLDTAAMIIGSDQIESMFPGLNLGKIVYLGPKRAVIVKTGKPRP